MKNQIKFFLYFIFLLSFFTSCVSTKKTEKPQTQFGNEMTFEKIVEAKEGMKIYEGTKFITERLEVPFFTESQNAKISCGSIFIKIDGKQYKFMLDTGCPYSKINKNAMQKLGLEFDENSEKEYFVFFKNCTFSQNNIGRFPLLFQSDFSDDENNDGILGMNFFLLAENFMFDFANRMIVFCEDTENFSSENKIPLSKEFFDSGDFRPRIEILLNGEKTTAFLDTGSNFCILDLHKFNIVPEWEEWQQISTTTGQAKMKNFHANVQVEFTDKLKLKVPVSMWDENAYKFFPSWKSHLEINGINLGVDNFFMEYKVLFDYRIDSACVCLQRSRM